MAIYLVEMPASGGKTLTNGVSTLLVEADDSSTALALAESEFSSDSTWSDATVTDVTTLSPADYLGWSLRVQVLPLAGGSPLHDVTAVGIAADTLNDLGDAVAALLVTSGTTATYVTPLVGVSTIGDALGDNELRVTLTPPDGVSAVADLVGVIVDQGIAGAVLTASLLIPTAIPATFRTLRS